MAFRDKKPVGRTPKARGRRPAINTYYRAEQKPGDSPFVKKIPKRPVRKFLFGFLDVIILAVLVLALVYALALKSNPIIDANDFSYHQKAVYAAAAQSQFGQLRNRNKLTFDESAVSRTLQAKFPEISDIQVELPFFSEQPVVHLTIAKPSFILESPDSSLVVDSSGVAVASASSLKIKGLPVIEDKSGYPAKAGSQVLSTESVNFINDLLAQCRRAKVPVASLTLPAAPEELQLRTRDSSYFVKFYLAGDVMQESGQFLAALQHFAQGHQPPSQYLDVRVSGRVFYK